VSVGAALLVALVVVGALTLSVGEFPVPVGDVVRSLLGRGDAGVDFIVLDLRLPRLVCGLLVGAAFGLAGALTQAVARNPLASPDVLGVTAGATAAAVAVLVLGGPRTTALPVAALVGGVLTAVVVFLLAARRGVVGVRLVLVGIGVSATLQAATNYLLLRADITQAQAATVWLTGSLNGRGWTEVVTVGVAVAVLLPVALLLTRPVGVLQFGDDTARGLGVRVGATRSVLVLLAVALAALATAAAGPIAFVALSAPQIAVRLVRTPGLPLVTAGLVGALLVATADLLARRLLAPTDLPVGVVTAVLGAPFLLWLLARASGLAGRP
jgi:iron complex transport system permease protein